MRFNKVSATYDNDNRLISGNGATLSYDPAGRLSQVSKGTVTRFLYDGAGTDVRGFRIAGFAAKTVR